MAGEHEKRFAVGTLVIIADSETLKSFLSNWTRGNRLSPDQMEYAGLKAVVGEVRIDNVGDSLYLLENIPGTWHGACFRASSIGHAYDHHEGPALWRALDNALRILEERREIEISVARTHVIGAFCEQLSRLGLVKSRSGS
jgi:hypothetical protein